MRKGMILIVLAALALAACEWFERDLNWKQEIRLQDGRALMIDRVSKVTGKSFPEGGNYDIYQSLTFAHPDTNERIAWAPPEHTGPVMLDVDGPNAYYVVEAISVGDYNQIGCPNPPYLVYRYADGQWKQTAINDMPARFVERNAQRRSMEDKNAVADGVVTAAELQAYFKGFSTSMKYHQIDRGKVNPIAEGCFEGVLAQQGRHLACVARHYDCQPIPK